MSAPPKTSRSLTDKLVETLGSDIARGSIAPGARFASEEVAREQHVSRGVVREAVRVLETLGMVSVRQRSGIVIRPSGEWNQYDRRVLAWRLAGPEREELLRSLNELMSAVAPLAARLAARRATTTQRRSLTTSVAGMAASSRAQDPESYLANQISFHTTVLSATGNSMLEQLVPAVQAIIRSRAERNGHASSGGSEAILLHGAAAAAIMQGDADGAAVALTSASSASCGSATGHG